MNPQKTSRYIGYRGLMSIAVPMMLAGAMLAITTNAKEPTAAGPPTERTQQYANAAPVREAPDDAVADFGASSATGQILFTRYAEDGMSLFLTPRAKGDADRLVARAVVGAQWSPDGRTFLYHDQAGDLLLQTPSRADKIATGVQAASFAPDGQTIALVRGPSPLAESTNGEGSGVDEADRGSRTRHVSRGGQMGLYLYTLLTSQEKLISKKVVTNYWFLGYAPAWSPDGTLILFLGERGPLDESTPVWVASVTSEQASPLLSDIPLPGPTTPLYWSPDGHRFLFGSETLDGEDQLWSVDFKGEERAGVRLLGPGRPISSKAESLTVETRTGLRILNTQTLRETTIPRRDRGTPIPGADAAIEAAASGAPGALAATASVYDVLYCKPLAGSSPSVSSWVSHGSVKPCSDGIYKYSCSLNGSSRAGHKGTDFAASLGTTIYAGAAGTVTAVGGGCGPTKSCSNTTEQKCNGSQGNYVNVKHSNGAVTRYMHMSKTKAVNAASVTLKSVLGYVGSTGGSTGCHVHFQIDFASVPYDPFAGTCSCPTTKTLWTTTSCTR